MLMARLTGIRLLDQIQTGSVSAILTFLAFISSLIARFKFLRKYQKNKTER